MNNLEKHLALAQLPVPSYEDIEVREGDIFVLDIDGNIWKWKRGVWRKVLTLKEEEHG